jgi:hypothetical protein
MEFPRNCRKADDSYRELRGGRMSAIPPREHMFAAPISDIADWLALV